LKILAQLRETSLSVNKAFLLRDRTAGPPTHNRTHYALRVAAQQGKRTATALRARRPFHFAPSFPSLASDRAVSGDLHRDADPSGPANVTHGGLLSDGADDGGGRRRFFVAIARRRVCFADARW
jgi:hypothetical protein